MLAQLPIALQPEFIAALLEAEMPPPILGAYHAERGIPCQFDLYDKEGEQRAYEEGYAETLDALHEEMPWEQWHAEETAAYVEAMLDEEDWAKGWW